jgi:hypothetical protein
MMQINASGLLIAPAICPLRVISDRRIPRQRRPMSAVAPIADKRVRGRIVRFVQPITDIVRDLRAEYPPTKNPGILPGVLLCGWGYRARSAVRSDGPRFVYYTLALFMAPPVYIIRVIEHYTPSLIQSSVV